MSRKRNYIKIAAAILLIAVGLLGCSTKDAQPQSEQQDEQQDMAQLQADEAGTESTEMTADNALSSAEEGFATPEEAVLNYLAGLRDSDFYRMAATFGEGSAAKNIPYQYALLCGIDQIPEIADSSVVILDEREDAEKMLEELTWRIEETDFGNMEFLGFVPPEELTDTYNSEAYQNGLPLIAQNNGGSELANLVAVIKISEKQYMLYFDTIKIDDRWYNFALGGILANVMYIEAEAVGVVQLDAHDEKVVKHLLSDNPESLPEPRVSEKTDEQLRVEGEGFDTPQQAAANYLEGFKAHDMEQMISTFAVESYAENYNMQAELEWMQSYIFTQEDVSLPPVNDFVKDMINYERKAQMIADILVQGNALYLLDEYYRNDSDVAQEYEPFDWEELTEKIDLDSIQILGYLPLESLSDSVAPEYLTKTQNRNAEIYGADETENCVIVYEYDGDKYCLFMETVKYNGKWYNYKIGDQVSGVLGIYTEYAGAGPLEAVGDPEAVESLIVPIE